MNAKQLLETIFPPQRWAVEDMIPEGVTVLAGKAKSGKSWFLLELDLAVAEGRPFLGRFAVQQGDVLHLGLEDSQRRMKDRLKPLLNGRPAPRHLHTETTWPKADDGGLQELDHWLDDFPGARLVVIDMMRNFSPVGFGYGQDTLKVEALGKLGAKRHLGIVAVFHMNKGAEVSVSTPDWMDKIQGSVGVTGAAQAVVGLGRARGAETGILRITGKDVPEQDVALAFDPERGLWTASGPPTRKLGESKPMTDEAKQILGAVNSNAGATAEQIADELKVTYNDVRHLLWAMTHRKQLIKSNGRYYTPQQAALAPAPIEPDPQMAFGQPIEVTAGF